jgi:hypothetical protein
LRPFPSQAGENVKSWGVSTHLMSVGAKIASKSAQRSVIFVKIVKNECLTLFFRPKLRGETAFGVGPMGAQKFVANFTIG